MLRLRVLALACCMAALGALCVQAQENDLKAILAKAVEAHGGEKNMTKFQAGSTKFKGTMKIMGQEINVTGETWLQKPNKMKSVLTLEKDGNSQEITRVYDGKKFWAASMGKTQEIKDEKILKEVRETLEAEAAGSMVDFQKKPYELSAIGEAKVKDKDAIGIRISKKGQRDINYFFDKKTYMLVKIETRSLDPQGQKEVTQEKFILGYQEKNGVQVAKRVVIHHDGEHFMDIEITDTQFIEKLDDSTFAMP